MSENSFTMTIYRLSTKTNYRLVISVFVIVNILLAFITMLNKYDLPLCEIWTQQLLVYLHGHIFLLIQRWIIDLFTNLLSIEFRSQTLFSYLNTYWILLIFNFFYQPCVFTFVDQIRNIYLRRLRIVTAVTKICLVSQTKAIFDDGTIQRK